MIKCRTAGFSEFKNYKYYNNERWVIPFFYLRILSFISQNKLENLKNLLFFICKMIKFPKFNNLENLWNLEKFLNTLCSSNFFKNNFKKFLNKIID